MSLLQFDGERLLFDNKPFVLVAGDMHYFRMFKNSWRKRLELMKDFGLTAVQTYVPWNLNEPEKGEYHFEDNLDLSSFLAMCNEVGLKVLLRPSVYICAEWDFGGLPYWLLKDRQMCIRSSDESFFQHVREYTKRLSNEFLPHLSTNGGAVIAVAVENEYGSFGNDLEYIKKTRDLLLECGVDVPFYTANGSDAFKISNGSLPDIWSGIDFDGDCSKQIQALRKFQTGFPAFAAEFWDGRATQWGGIQKKQSSEELAQAFETALQHGMCVDFYMFCGCTNFGFYSGSNEGFYLADLAGAKERYIPFCTSYDFDAPISENGATTEKYYACRDVLDRFLGKPVRTDRFPAPKTQEMGKVYMKESAGLLEQADCICDKKVQKQNVLCMEDLGQDYGFIMYSTNLKRFDGRKCFLRIKGLHDRATVYGNGQYLGSCMRDCENEDIVFTIPEEGLKLDILVENMGRICYGHDMINDRKGITEYVKLDVQNADGSFLWNYALIMNWTIRTLSLRKMNSLVYESNTKHETPAFYKAEVAATPGVDTFISMKGWVKGNVWVNGFNLGRYWNIGPQETLYVPGELIKENNTVEVFEIHCPNEDMSVTFVKEPVLDTIEENVDLVFTGRV